MLTSAKPMALEALPQPAPNTPEEPMFGSTALLFQPTELLLWPRGSIILGFTDSIQGSPGSFWWSLGATKNGLGTPVVDFKCLGIVLAASGAIVATHRAPVRPTYCFGAEDR